MDSHFTPAFRTGVGKATNGGGILHSAPRDRFGPSPVGSRGATRDTRAVMPRRGDRRKPEGPLGAKILFIAGFGPIIKDSKASRRLYVDTFGIDFGESNGYLHTDKLDGAKAFALWPLSQAAESCFGKTRWPPDLPVPQGWLEFDVEDVAGATEALQQRGYRLLVINRKEPWGQTVTRLLSPEGLLVGVTHTPWMRPRS